MTHTGLFINSVDSVELFPRPPRKHCIPVMKKRTPSVGWSPILSGDFPPAVFSSLLLPSDSWNKLTWEANQRTFLGQPASPWKSCLWLLLRPQTQVGECLRWCSQYTFSMVLVTCDLWGLFLAHLIWGGQWVFVSAGWDILAEMFHRKVLESIGDSS